MQVMTAEFFLPRRLATNSEERQKRTRMVWSPSAVSVTKRDNGPRRRKEGHALLDLLRKITAFDRHNDHPL